MRNQSRVKVQTDKLLQAVKARRAQMVAEHERATIKYDKDRESYRLKAAEALSKAADAALAGKLPDHEGRYNGKRLMVPVRFEQPSKPHLATDQIDRLIATLEMAADPTMTISAEDAARFLG